MLALFAAAPANAEITNPNGVAVIIGNSAYQGGLPEVTYAGNDADAFRAYVMDVLGYDPDNIIDLRDATQAQMIATFGNADNIQGRLWRLVEPGLSDVVVFYSGHGVPGEDRRAYLLPGMMPRSFLRARTAPLRVTQTSRPPWCSWAT